MTTNILLKRRGYVSMLEMYGEINPLPRSSTEGNLRTAVYANEKNVNKHF